ncbi:TetR family transcriptional regulator [Bacillus oleivorans]|uniref:TetR family transcriptional regulator n=1 Tax=Bacillus oleivorans TaxID=1448271 RepID=A0A285CP88_9BACI|nr:TetR/AcrR family transcriptional regulator [Bacillus oleivorans]SNX68793.1 TetR family transcriptional regulator [Bacillus oleivorans]
MPKLVDHEKRKKQIAEATWRVIVEQGMEGATVRNIAKEAGISLGSLRHYFSTQEELLAYSMNLVKENVTARVLKIAAQELPIKAKALKMLLELVPTNKESMAESEVWFTFIAYSRHKERFDANQDGVLLGIQQLMKFLRQFDLLKPDINFELETERLYAVIDGLALHAMLNPNRVNRDLAEKVLVRHLEEICEE